MLKIPSDSITAFFVNPSCTGRSACCHDIHFKSHFLLNSITVQGVDGRQLLKLIIECDHSDNFLFAHLERLFDESVLREYRARNEIVLCEQYTIILVNRVKRLEWIRRRFTCFKRHNSTALLKLQQRPFANLPEEEGRAVGPA
jgi:hypothetical protein